MAENGIESNTEVPEDFLTWEEMAGARSDIMKSGFVGQTPLIKHMQYLFPELAEQGIDLNLKLENMQNEGSFKIRGVVNQISKIKSKMADQNHRTKFVTISAGNYGKAFAYMLQQRSLSGLCIMPDSAQKSKIEMIKSYGVKVELCPTADLMSKVDHYVAEQGYHFCHPFDDRDLIAGYASIGLEIIEVLPEFDILIICCGGGGLAAGISSAVRARLKSNVKIYAVEPEGAPTMFQSFKNKMAASIPTVKSIASGLAPPYAGKRTYKFCQEFVDDVILVTDAEILGAMQRLYHAGLVVEPSGCAAMAALLSNRISDVKFKKIVVIVSGGNISPDEIKELIT